MNAAQELVEVIRQAMRPRLLFTVPAGEPNEGAQEWQQSGAEEVALAVAAWLCPVCNPRAASQATEARQFGGDDRA